MFRRLIRLPASESFFLFGPRGTGKSTLLQERYSVKKWVMFDLLDPTIEDVFLRDPAELEKRVLALPKSTSWVVLDEIQKAPRLLDVVHRLIEKTPKRFLLTGSSARKLKRGGANLLAGRAFVYALHPLTTWELGSSFHLDAILRWGSLPKIFHLKNDAARADFLRAYALTYMKEEIVAEQIVRRLDPFRHFLEVAAQCNGQILNYAKIGRDIGADDKTVQSFFSILEETLLGFLLPAYAQSVRKRQRTQPKFYFFDTGVKRALERTLENPVLPKTWEYGRAFEHLVLLECFRLGSYFKPDWRFSYLQTKDGVEIDLIIDRPGLKTVLVEIKSSTHVGNEDVASLVQLAPGFTNAESYCLSLDPHPKRIKGISCLPWKNGLEEMFGLSNSSLFR